METKETLLKKINSVAEFHDVFLIGNADKPQLINERDYTLRFNLIKEENIKSRTPFHPW